MFAHAHVKLLAAVAALAAPAYLAACGGYGTEPRTVGDPIPLVGSVTRDVVRDGHFYAVTANGRLIDVDLKKRQARDLGDGDCKLQQPLDVADGTAYVASERELITINLATGRVKLGCRLESPARGLSFVGKDKVLVRDDHTVGKVDVCWGTKGKPLVEFGKDKKGGTFHMAKVAHQKVGDRLYVANGWDGCLTVVDLTTHKVEEIKDVVAKANDIQVVGGKVFVTGGYLSYGVWMPECGIVDLKTRKRTKLEQPRLLRGPYTLVTGPNDTFFLVSAEGSYHYDAEGRAIGALLDKDAGRRVKVETRDFNTGEPLAPPTVGRVVGAWDGHAVVASKESLQLVKLPLPKPAK